MVMLMNNDRSVLSLTIRFLIFQTENSLVLFEQYFNAPFQPINSYFK